MDDKREILTQLVAAEIAYGGRLSYGMVHDTRELAFIADQIIKATEPKGESSHGK